MYYAVHDEEELLKVQKRVKEIPGKVLAYVECAYLEDDYLVLEIDEDGLTYFDLSSEIDALQIKGITIEPKKDGEFSVEIKVSTVEGNEVHIQFNDLKSMKYISL